MSLNQPDRHIARTLVRACHPDPEEQDLVFDGACTPARIVGPEDLVAANDFEIDTQAVLDQVLAPPTAGSSS